MRERVSILLATAMTVVGLAAGAVPAHAAPKPAEDIGVAHDRVKFGGSAITLQRHATCARINLPDWKPARSAVNTGQLGDIRLFFDSSCSTEVAYLTPGGRNNGFITNTTKRNVLGYFGALYYSST